VANDSKVMEALSKFMKVFNKKEDGDAEKVHFVGVGWGQQYLLQKVLHHSLPVVIRMQQKVKSVN
jgi:hypothetical protein